MQTSAVDKVANYNCTILDVAKVTIGDNCFMAPNVAIYTAGHPIYPDVRSAMWEYGKEVTFGDERVDRRQHCDLPWRAYWK